MATTTFSGPIKAGTIKNTTGTTLGSDVKNVGFTVMAQSAAITQSTTAAATGIVIPANSQILEATVFVTTAFDNTATLSIGTTASSNELATAVAVSTANVIKLASQATITDADAWEDVGTTDVEIYVDSSATTADAGVGTLTVTYIQNNNLA
tara:strand:- start:522 stop:977 length:456 start_codon:yes stop_codon:yes gene_type:complete